MKILREGGNAFDAAIVVSSMLGVVEPQGSGIGGGGFFLLHTAENGRTIFLDARERAPLEAHRDMYLDSKGQVDSKLSLDGPLAAGIPGIPAAWGHLAGHYGTLPLEHTLKPAIAMARRGFSPDRVYLRARKARSQILERYPESRVYLEKKVHLPKLADTLELLSLQGAHSFYNGHLAKLLVQGVRNAGGIWREIDLQQYRIIERIPIRIPVRGAEIITAPLPSASGIILAQVFQMVGKNWWNESNDTARAHRLVEVLRRTYLDRATYLGDPAYAPSPVEYLTSEEYARKRMADFDPEAITPTQLLLETAQRGDDTSHFSILDAEGNWVSATLSINGPFGSGFVVPGTGVLLNNEMDDFSARPGVPNLYGLIGSEANSIAPGKRMLSSMAPTVIADADRTLLLGSPGGSRITTIVLQGIFSFLDGDEVEDIVANPRFHHQALPDEVQIEADRFDEFGPLQKLGHKIVKLDGWGNMQAVLWNRTADTLAAASDPRGAGKGSVELSQR